MRFSIVVPVYNVQKYIGKCMESLVSQSFRDYEIIVVDDESPDGSMEIVESYRKKNPDRIRVVHQKNTRQGGARNHGVQLARGEYIVFVDSDDYVSPHMLEVLNRRLEETACDILVFNGISVTENGKLLPDDSNLTLKPGIYHPSKTPDVVLIPGAPWGKVFKREFYVETGFSFPERILYEDVTTRILYAQAHTVSVCEDRLYYYVHRENSSMTQKLSEKMLDILTVTDIVLSEFTNKNLYNSFKSPLDISLIYAILCIEEIISLQEPDSPMQEKIADYLSEHFKDYEKNPYGDPALTKVLDLLCAHDFKGYHRLLKINGLKDRLKQNRMVRKLIELRKKGGCMPFYKRGT